MATEQKPKRNQLSDYTAERIGEVIIGMLENCEKTSWDKEWLPICGMAPMNLLLKKGYSMRNSLFCAMAQMAEEWKTLFFLTRNQINDLGLSVRKGQQPTPILQYFPTKAFNKDTKDVITRQEYDELDESEKGEYQLMFSLGAIWEFNIDQTDMADLMPEEYQAAVNAATESERKLAERHITDCGDPILDHIIEEDNWWCPIRFDGGDKAYCQHDHERTEGSFSIHLPKVVQFNKRTNFYSTALHEMAHSTSCPLKRNYGVGGFGSSTYAKEELVAELASAIVCHDLGIESKIDENHLVYVNHWKSHCKDKEVISKIVVDMMKATKYIINYYDETAEELQELGIAI